MIKVLHICQRDDTATGGAARVAVELIKGSASRGINARCLFVYGEPDKFSAEIPGRASHLRLYSSRNVITGWKRLLAFLLQEKPDIIHHHDGLIWTHCLTSQWRCSIRFGHAHVVPPGKGSKWRSRIAHALHRRTYQHLLCVSDAIQAEWLAVGFPPGQISVIPNGVDTALFRPAGTREKAALRAKWETPPEAKIVGFVGRLDTETKGCDDFISMLSSLPDDYWGVIAGAGPDEQYLRAMATKAGLGRRIRFLGLVDPSREAYWGMDVFVLASRTESFGLVVLEAAASGLPVVVFPARGGVMELAEKLECVVLDSRDPGMAAERVLEVTKSIDSQKLGARRSAVESIFSWEAAVTKVVFCYREFLN